MVTMLLQLVLLVLRRAKQFFNFMRVFYYDLHIEIHITLFYCKHNNNSSTLKIQPQQNFDEFKYFLCHAAIYSASS